MPTTISDIEDYFSKGCGRCPRFDSQDCSTKQWAEGLKALRRICLSEGLSETLKWARPCYMHTGQNIVIIGAFRDNFRLSLFNAALMQDSSNMLERQGPNTKHKDMLRFTANGQVSALESVIRQYLKEAMAHAEAGLRPPRDSNELSLPEELIKALDSDPELAEAFQTLTPGRRKSYVINLNSAKQSQTRLKRIEKFRDKIFAGKGALER